jgi:hypothetical protein
MMRQAAILVLCAALAACADMPKPLTRADRIASFDKVQLAQIDETACAQELGRESHSERWWLCGYGWRPAQVEGVDKAVESYRLYWVRAAEPRLLMRIARYGDGSAALWITVDGKTVTPAGPHAEVTTLKQAEFTALFTQLEASPLWASGSSYARPSGGKDADKAECKGLARWILEGEREGDHRAVSAQSCGEGGWVIGLGTDMLHYAKAKIPSLKLDPIY